jgi:hypothetical protein
MKIWYGGSEIPGWRTLLEEEQIPHVALSFVGLGRRNKFTKPWIVAERYPDWQQVFLDSGAHSLNKRDDIEEDTLLDLYEKYRSLVMANLDRIAMVSEFDALALGTDWMERQRTDFWADIPTDKFVPIWHAEQGLGALEALCDRFPQVGVTASAMGGRDLAPFLGRLHRTYGTWLHGVNMSKVEEMQTLPWHSISTISWLSPAQYGDTIVWTGRELKRYPKKMKEQARKRHRTVISGAGLNPELIENDDPKEVLRLSLWSWRQLEAKIDRRHLAVVPEGESSNSFAEQTSGANVVTDDTDVDTKAPEAAYEGTTSAVLKVRERINLPIFGQITKTVPGFGEDGAPEEQEITLLNSRSESLRMCDTCFLASKCPAMEPKSNCVYDIPMEIRTKDQLDALQDSLIEIQAQRVAFMRMSEDLEGGYADPNLSNELDRLGKMIQRKQDSQDERVSINIQAQARGQAGMISRIFGRDAGDSVRALPGGPISVERAMEDSPILDAEVID